MNGEGKDAQARPSSAPERRELEPKQQTPAKEPDALDEQSIDDVLRECPL